MQVTKHNDKVYIIGEPPGIDINSRLLKLEGIEFITLDQALEMGITTEPTRRTEFPIHPCVPHQHFVAPLTRSQRRKQSRYKTISTKHR